MSQVWQDQMRPWTWPKVTMRAVSYQHEGVKWHLESSVQGRSCLRQNPHVEQVWQPCLWGHSKGCSSWRWNIQYHGFWMINSDPGMRFYFAMRWVLKSGNIIDLKYDLEWSAILDICLIWSMTASLQPFEQVIRTIQQATKRPSSESLWPVSIRRDLFINSQI